MYEISKLGIQGREYQDQKQRVKDDKRRLRLIRKNRRKRKAQDGLMPIYTEDVTVKGIEAGLEIEQLFRKRRDWL